MERTYETESVYAGGVGVGLVLVGFVAGWVLPEMVIRSVIIYAEKMD